MNQTYSNPCTRCGKERIVSKTWEEQVGYSTIVNIEKICPNPACQKEVEKDNQKQRDKRTEMKLRSEQRAHNRRKLK